MRGGGEGGNLDTLAEAGWFSILYSISPNVTVGYWMISALPPKSEVSRGKLD